ncbi:MAG TPA: hypothetical protein VGL44_05620 [Gaiellales bacterium]
MKRLSVGLGPLLVLALAGCTHTPFGQPGGPAAAPRLAHMRRDGIAFSYPAAWRYRRRGFLTTMSEGIVDLSTQRMVDPCRTHGNATTCSWPTDHLRPGGIVVSWSRFGGLVAPGHLPRSGVTVKTLRDPYCRRVGGAVELEGRIVTRRHRVYDVDACLARPGLLANAIAFRAMLASARPG